MGRHCRRSVPGRGNSKCQCPRVQIGNTQVGRSLTHSGQRLDSGSLIWDNTIISPYSNLCRTCLP